MGVQLEMCRNHIEVEVPLVIHSVELEDRKVAAAVAEGMRRGNADPVVRQMQEEDGRKDST